MKETREEMMARIKLQYEQGVKDWKDYWASKQDCEFLDEEGYPTEDAYLVIEKWHWIDQKGWFEFIKSIWYFARWGWEEREELHEWKDEMVTRHFISTAGWSGNEAIIRAMQNNHMMWHLTWVQSRRGGHYIFERGGHYIFELQEIKDE